MNPYALAMAFAPSVAIAQDAATEVPPWMQIAIAIGAAVGGYLIKLLRTYVNSLADVAAKKSNLAFLAHVDDVLFKKVNELWLTEVKAMKAAAADGKLTPAEKADMKAKAVDWAKGLVDVGLLGEIFQGPGNVDKVLGTIVESSVATLKAAGKKPDPSTP